MKIEGLPLDLQIASALAKKAQVVQRQEGQAAVDLIEAAAAPPAPRSDGVGSVVNTKA